MSGFSLMEKNGIKYFAIEKFKDIESIDHLFTTRIGGVSTGNYNSLNLGLNTEDNRDNIIENFMKIAEIINTSIEKMVLSNQVHETNIRVVTEEDMGKGLIKDRDYESVDGLVTNIKGLPLVTFYADCVPLFFVDSKKEVIGLAHAGWKGTVGKIGSKMIDVFQSKFKSNLEDIFVAIGPSIGPCCYIVNRDVANKFYTNFTKADMLIKSIGEDDYVLDLWKANEISLKEKGIKDRNIILSDVCTSCNNEILYSYRKELGKTGRMVAVIKIKE